MVVSTVPAAEVLARLAPDERRWVEELRDQLRARFGARLRDLRIYGSKVRGDDHDESDIDLLVLVEGLKGPDWEAVLDMAHAISTWLSPAVIDFDDYHTPRSRASGFYQEMRKESVRL